MDLSYLEQKWGVGAPSKPPGTVDVDFLFDRPPEEGSRLPENEITSVAQHILYDNIEKENINFEGTTANFRRLRSTHSEVASPLIHGCEKMDGSHQFRPSVSEAPA